MKTVKIVFTKPKNRIFPVFSWIIRMYLGTQYSHVAIKFSSESLNRDIIYEAVGSGVRFVGKRVWEKKIEEVVSYQIDVKYCNYTTIMQYCIDHAGIEYGLLQNIGIFIVDVFKLKKNPFRHGKNCSEVIAEILTLEGFEFNKSMELVTPKDIQAVLEKD